MSNIVQRDSTEVAVAPEPVSLLQVIERASRDPNVDIDKMERLMAMHERMTAKQAESEFNDAIVACQNECGTISADATNPQTRSKYASYAQLDRTLRPIYTKHGFSLSFDEGESKPEMVRVVCIVWPRMCRAARFGVVCLTTCHCWWSLRGTPHERSARRT